MSEIRSEARPEAGRVRLTSGEFWGDDPHVGLAWLRANDPVYWDADGGIWGLATYRDVRDASRQPEIFSNAAGIRPYTGPVISGGQYQMLANRDNWERARADRGLLPSAIEEMLRWVSPIRNMARALTRDITLGGKRLQAGQKALLLYPSANRDEDVFPDPFRFDITRKPNDHLAFGHGTHFCLGNSLARLELDVMFRVLLDRLPDIRLAVPDEPALRPAAFVSGYEDLKVEIQPDRAGRRHCVRTARRRRAGRIRGDLPNVQYPVR